jgi:hypothetical protein
VVLLQSNLRLLKNTDLTRIEGFLRQARLRALVDPLALDVVGPLLELLEAPDRARAESVLDRWAQESDGWLRRAALLSPVRALRAGKGDWDRFVRHARAADRPAPDAGGDVVGEAIALVLREVAKTRPELHLPLPAQ